MEVTIKSASGRVTKKGHLLDNLRLKIKQRMDTREVANIVQDAANAMGKRIANMSSRQPTSGVLAELLSQIEIIPGKDGTTTYGIGNKDLLNRPKEAGGAPYWYVVNYGHASDTNEPYVPPVNFGTFSSSPLGMIAGGSGQTWYGGRGKGNGSIMIPKNAIFSKEGKEPFHYIEFGQRYIQKRLARFNGYKSR